ncbi:MAG TPA: hypothetical protein VER17_01335 [Tepidisphaeraceae bacterium]|nr:hypothetical protein [Tepidisphaeraceae bacterium]
MTVVVEATPSQAPSDGEGVEARHGTPSAKAMAKAWSSPRTRPGRRKPKWDENRSSAGSNPASGNLLNAKMNDGFYADVRDVAKWSRAVQLCSDHGFDRIVYVGMVTKAMSWETLTRTAGFSRPDVIAFFDRERAAIAHGEARRADRICALPKYLGDGYGMRLGMQAVLDEFTGSEANRKAYFAQVVRLLPEVSAPALVVVDPDNGIGVARGPKRRSRQIRRSEFCQVAAALPAGSAIMLVQFDLRSADWQSGGALDWLQNCLSPVQVFHDDPGLTHYVYLKN